MELTDPLFVIEGLDVSLYHRAVDIERQLEGVDVEDGCYRVFDADGRVLTLEVVGVRRRRFMVDVGTVRVVGADEEPSGENELRAALAAHLRGVGDASVSERDDLPTLVARCKQVHSYE